MVAVLREEVQGPEYSEHQAADRGVEQVGLPLGPAQPEIRLLLAGCGWVEGGRVARGRVVAGRGRETMGHGVHP